MKNHILTLALLLLAGVQGAWAQAVTSEPTPLQTDSKDVVIYFHADRGNKGLMNVPPETAIYAHTGYLVAGSDVWQGVPAEWNKNIEKCKMKYVSENLWKLDIGDIRTFYGITDPAVHPDKLAFVFRDATGNRTGRGPNGADIFLDVVADGFALNLTTDLEGGVITTPGTKASFTASATQDATITLSVNGTQVAREEKARSLSAQYTFSDVGSYTVTATATAGNETLTEEMSLYLPDSSPAADYPGGKPVMGAVRQKDGSVLFCLAAPGKTNAMLIGSWAGYAPGSSSVMNYQDVDGVRYFWARVEGLDADKMYMYYYFVDGSRRVGDPYARLVLDPQNDKYIPTDVFPELPAYPSDKVQNVSLAVYWENINNYPWEIKDFIRPDKEDLVIYELLLRDFTGTEGKAEGNGTVRKAIDKIPYLVNLGINAVELLPINEFNGNISWGYNPNFYFAPDKAYGTPDDYKEFIDACHRNGIAVILDMVFNQTDWQHPWYQLYDVGSNPFFNATAPHAYSVLNDWNQGYPLVQTQFKDVLAYWLKEYNVDGFRFDLVKGLGNNDSYANSGDAATNAYNASRVARMKELQAAVEAVSPGAYFINENLAEAKEENEMAAYGQLNWANINHQAMQFAKGEQPDSGLDRFYAPLDSRKWGSTVSYAESHDEQRLAFGQKTSGVAGVRGNIPTSMRRLGSMAAQMLMTPGPHMIWQFSELGNEQSTKSGNNNNTDPKIVNWALFDNPDRHGLYDCYSQLIAIRKGNRDMFDESADIDVRCAAADWENGRTINITKGNRQILLAVNPSVTKTITVSARFASTRQADFKVLSQSYNTTPQFDAAAGTITLSPNSYVVLGTQDISGIDAPDATSFTRQPEVYGAEGRIMILGADASAASVHALDGTPMTSVENLRPGIYVVRLGAHSYKVAVR